MPDTPLSPNAQAALDAAFADAAPVTVAPPVHGAPRGVSDEQLAHWFTHHPPTPEQVVAYGALRAAALAFARTIRDLCPPGADATAAIRKVREAVMTANAAIACGGR